MITTVGYVKIGEAFVYDGGMFVTLPFDWEDEKYYNLCIATRNYSYDVGDKYFFEHDVEVKTITRDMLKNDFIPEDWT